MSKEAEIRQIYQDGRRYFETGKTLDGVFRIKMLRRLRRVIQNHETAIYRALKLDLNKSEQEALMTELSMVYNELDYAVKNLPIWMKPKTCRSALTQMPGKTKVYHQPYGVTLIMSPWNYPFQLAMIPLIGSIAAGNCTVVKPSAKSRHTTAVVEKIIRDAFPRGYVGYVGGTREESKELLELPFDMIFFTGSPKAGRFVMEKAAKHLTPVLLELGGKSPVLVDETADLKKTARRIAFGKLLNAGQTCVAPDYILVHESVRDKLVKELSLQFDEMITDDDYADEYYPRIINEERFETLVAMLDDVEILYGGRVDAAKWRIYPTITGEPAADHPLAQEEIFGPILPVWAYRDEEEAIQHILKRPTPLALYYFTDDENRARRIIHEIPYGGGCINDCVLHLATHYAPFGGLGNSGMGRYHGYDSFLSFGHQKTILHKTWAVDNMMRHHPYNETKLGLLKKLL